MRLTQHNIGIGDVFSFVAPIFQIVQIQLAGTLLASDVLLLAALPVAYLRHPERLRQKPIPAILALGSFWLMAQIVTDLLRNTAPTDYIRGWSKIFFLLVNIVVVWVVVCRTRRRFVYYGIGLALGAILGFFVYPSAEALISPWKFAIGVPVTMLVAMWTAHSAKSPYIGVFVPLVILAVVHAFEDFRILAVISFVTAIYVLSLKSALASNRQFGKARAVALALTVVLGMVVFGLVYGHYAKQGVFGRYAQHKLEAQEDGEGGLLLGGRSEILASGPAIIDSPLLGHGSWARDPTYSGMLADRRAELGYKNYRDLGGGGSRDDLIPTHSYIFGAWVEAGVAGGLFWLFILAFTVHTLLKASGSVPLLPIFAFSGFMLIWDILFSPLGSPTRFVAPYFVVAMVLLRVCGLSQRPLAEDF
jgi:hypothetical protein